jgi:hypothetical protein
MFSGTLLLLSSFLSTIVLINEAGKIHVLPNPPPLAPYRMCDKVYAVTPFVKMFKYVYVESHPLHLQYSVEHLKVKVTGLIYYI